MLFVLCSVSFGSVASETPSVLPHHYANPGRIDPSVFRGQPDWQRRTRRLVSRAEQQLPFYGQPNPSGIVSVTDFGADPTGGEDSTQAFAAAVKKLLTLGGGRKNAANQTDLGGAILSLDGGVFSISNPVAIPAGYANYRVERGTLIAHENFGTGKQHLLELGGVCSGGTTGLSKNCATDISVVEVTLDGRDRAWGGVHVTSAVNVNVGPQVMVIGFQGVGIELSGCGAGYVHDSWVSW